MTTTDTLRDLQRQLAEGNADTSAAFKKYTTAKEIADALAEAVKAFEKVVGLTFGAQGTLIVNGNADFGPSVSIGSATPSSGGVRFSFRELDNVTFPALGTLVLQLFDEGHERMTLDAMLSRIKDRGQLNPSIKDPTEAIRVACIRLEKQGKVRRSDVNTYQRVQESVTA